MKVGIAAAKSVSKKRLFKSVNQAKMDLLKQRHLKKRTLAKVKSGVKAYQEWRLFRMSKDETYDEVIFNANLDDLGNLTKEALCYALCRFVPEVTKVEGGDYPGKTLYEMIIAIQKHLREHGLKWKLIDDSEFSTLRNVLDNVMKERAQANIGMIKKQAQLISMDFENMLWDTGVLGEENPDKLRSTVLFLIGVNCGIRAGDEHYDLRRDGPTKKSQFKFERNEKGVRCIVYNEDTTTKTNDGGISSLKNDRKVVWINPNSNINRCPVRLIDKYLSLLPPVKNENSKHNFYLRSMERPNPAQWYTTRVVGLNTLKKTIGQLLKNAKLDGYFTNHSLRRTGTTRLFQAGVDRKLLKEFTGHRSDAVDKYAITSHDQRTEMSNILAGNSKSLKSSNMSVPLETVTVENVIPKETPSTCSCNCKTNQLKTGEAKKVGDMITEIVTSRKSSKTVVKIEIEFTD